MYNCLLRICTQNCRNHPGKSGNGLIKYFEFSHRFIIYFQPELIILQPVDKDLQVL